MKKALLESFIWRGIYFITTLLLNVCIARLYEASESGWIYYISNNFYLVLLVSSLSLDSSMMYFSASKQISDGKLALFSVSWSFIVMVSTMLAVACLMKLNYVSSNNLFILVAGTAYTFGISLTNFFSSLFYAKQNFAVPNILLSGVNILVVTVMFLQLKGLLQIAKADFLYIYFLQFVLQGVSLAALYLLHFTKLPTLKYPTKKECKWVIRFALISLAANIAYYLIYRIDYLFVQAYCSANLLGNYVQVSKMGQLLLIIPSIISSAIYPQASSGNNANVISLIFRMFTLFIVFYIFVVIASFMWANQLFTWTFGSTFNEMSSPFLILLPGILFLSLHILIAAYFGGNNKPFYNLLSTGAGLLVVLAGDFLLIKKMGITGAALVSTLGYCTAFIVSLSFLINRTGTRWKEIFSNDMLKLKTYASIFNPQTFQSK